MIESYNANPWVGGHKLALQPKEQREEFGHTRHENKCQSMTKLNQIVLNLNNKRHTVTGTSPSPSQRTLLDRSEPYEAERDV